MFDLYILPWIINIAFAVAIFVIGKILITVILGLVGKILKRSKMDNMLINFILAIANAVLLLVVIVAALDSLGIDTTSMIAIVGAAGLAIGLSLQDSLKNFAAGVMLLLFKPFKEGDFVEVAGVSGIVEKIAIFTSVMRSADNRELIIPNGSIYSDVITNFSARETRRVDMVFGIGYDADLRQAKQLLVDIISEDARVLKDPDVVIAVSELADSSVNFIVRPWVNSADYWGVLWDTTEKVKLRFDEAGVSIPYPQMDVHLHKQDK